MVTKTPQPAPVSAPNAPETQQPTAQAKAAESLEAHNAEAPADDVAALKARIAELEAAAPKVKAPRVDGLVMIEALMPIRLDSQGDRVLAPGDVAAVTEAEAKEFADKVIVGHFGTSGESSEASAHAGRHRFKRAKRVA